MSRRAKTPTVIGVVAVLGLAAWWLLRPGIVIHLHNSDAQTLYDVTVVVTGETYPLGDMAPGAHASVRVNPRGESSVEIRFRNSRKDLKSLDAGGYFERDYRGTAVIEFDSNRIIKSEFNIRLFNW